MSNAGEYQAPSRLFHIQLTTGCIWQRGVGHYRGGALSGRGHGNHTRGYQNKKCAKCFQSFGHQRAEHWGWAGQPLLDSDILPKVSIFLSDFLSLCPYKVCFQKAKQHGGDIGGHGDHIPICFKNLCPQKQQRITGAQDHLHTPWQMFTSLIPVAVELNCVQLLMAKFSESEKPFS